MSAFSFSQSQATPPFHLGPSNGRRPGGRSRAEDNTVSMGDLRTRHETTIDMSDLGYTRSDTGMRDAPTQTVASGSLSPASFYTNTRSHTDTTLMGQTEPKRASRSSSQVGVTEPPYSRYAPPMAPIPAYAPVEPQPQVQEADNHGAARQPAGAAGATQGAATTTRCCGLKKKYVVGGVALILIGAGVGAGVGISKSHSSDDSSDSNYQGSSDNGALTSNPGFSSTRYSTPFSPSTTSTRTSSSLSRSTTAPAVASTSPVNLAWTPGKYTVNFNKILDTCANFDVTCSSTMSDTWYVTGSGSGYQIIANQNTTSYSVPTTGSQLTFGPSADTFSNSDGCLFDRKRVYALTAQGARATGTLDIAIGYNLDIQCVESSGTFLSQGASCDCRWSATAS